ncbi:MAG: hypothetical protein N2112_03600 [Gemmataceae bacterium]|jgi:hypothetical protein|nr:hypothetical protein [Gemmataceae bacterium]
MDSFVQKYFPDRQKKEGDGSLEGNETDLSSEKDSFVKRVLKKDTKEGQGPPSPLERIRKDGRYLYLVRGEDKGKKAWYYVLIDKQKLNLFKARLRLPDLIPLNEFGVILECGWGKDPPAIVVQRIKQEYGIEE